MTQTKAKNEVSPAQETQGQSKALRKRTRNRKLALPSQPAYPVKALWEMATPEQRAKAHEAAGAMMEYWLGRITKQDLSERLKTPPLRIWQLSQQAISGMVAGLLIQPKTRAPKSAKNQGVYAPEKPEDDPRLLRRRIAELETKTDMQDRLIAILREMPGCRDVTIPMETPQTEPQEEAVTHAMHARTATPKATSLVQAGVRHESKPSGTGTAQDPAKRPRSGA